MTQGIVTQLGDGRPVAAIAPPERLVVNLEMRRAVAVLEAAKGGQTAALALQQGGVAVAYGDRAPIQTLCQSRPQIVTMIGAPAVVAGGGSASADVFVQDVTCPGGIAADKGWRPSTPAQQHIREATTDKALVRIHVGAHGGEDDYTPTVMVHGVSATLTESTTRRWFVGHADVTLPGPGDHVLTVVSSAGGRDTVVVHVAGAGPEVTGITFGSFPGLQTLLKAGDAIPVTISTEPGAVSVTIEAWGASAGALTLPVTAGVATGMLTISSASGAQSIRVAARNALGTAGNPFTSVPLPLDQVAPVIATPVVSYPAGQGALKGNESATVTAAVAGADTVSYVVDSRLTLDNPDYAATKTVARTSGTYAQASYTIHATRAANGATASRTAYIALAHTPPTAAISIGGNPARLTSSPAGNSYTVVVTTDQQLGSPPTLTATIGSWVGSWSGGGNTWSRQIRITDADPRGTGVFAFAGTNQAGVTGTTITSGAAYTVGGFSSRVVTFPAFSRVADIGVPVASEAKTSASIVGGNTLTRHSDSGVRSNGYYIADADGSYNPTGRYLGLSDAAFAGANTTGTLQAQIAEAA